MEEKVSLQKIESTSRRIRLAAGTKGIQLELKMNSRKLGQPRRIRSVFRR